MGTGGGTVPREGLEGLDSRSASLTFSESTADEKEEGHHYFNAGHFS